MIASKHNVPPGFSCHDHFTGGLDMTVMQIAARVSARYRGATTRPGFDGIVSVDFRMKTESPDWKAARLVLNRQRGLALPPSKTCCHRVYKLPFKSTDYGPNSELIARTVYKTNEDWAFFIGIFKLSI